MVNQPEKLDAMKGGRTRKRNALAMLGQHDEMETPGTADEGGAGIGIGIRTGAQDACRRKRCNEARGLACGLVPLAGIEPASSA
jgi:hypothetical protein